MPGPGPRDATLPPRAPWRSPRLLAAGALLLAAAAAGCPPSASSAPAGPDGGDAGAPARARPAVVTPSAALAEMIYALDAGEHLVGVSRFCTYPPAAQRLPQIGGMIDPNLEAIDALRPDAVLTQGRNEQLLAFARRRSFEVHDFQIERLEQVHAALRRLGGLLDRAEAAEREVARLEAALAEVAAAAPADAPRVLLVFGRRPGELGQLSSPGVGTFVSECLVIAGGQNCLEGLSPRAWHVVSLEYLVERAPELIVELVDEGTTAETARALRADWARLGSIPAVRDGRIAVVAGSELLVPGPRLDQLARKLSRALNGELDVR